ncbi:MAG TPA: M64 family metallopeptidase, partial [Kofleriaceae bacterium]|nr:M64 family metallopeptidase [Kofleriaceae bacterium]
EGGGECRHDPAPNIAFSTDRGRIPWGRQLSSLVPLPTPETATYAGALGAFTGAQYCATGAFRPQLTCLMRELGRGFCRVCLGRVDRVIRTIARGGRTGSSPGGGDGELGCGNGTCDGDETDATCPGDCGCAAASCGVAPYGCYCDQSCRLNGDCCADACAACGSC